jgi:hypothetical protein
MAKKNGMLSRFRNSFGLGFSTIGTNIDGEQNISYKSFHAFVVEIHYHRKSSFF